MRRNENRPQAYNRSARKDADVDKQNINHNNDKNIISYTSFAFFFVNKKSFPFFPHKTFFTCLFYTHTHKPSPLYPVITPRFFFLKRGQETSPCMQTSKRLLTSTHTVSHNHIYKRIHINIDMYINVFVDLGYFRKNLPRPP